MYENGQEKTQPIRRKDAKANIICNVCTGEYSDIENGNEEEMREYNEGKKKADRHINRAGWGKK